MAPATEVLWQRYRADGDVDARAELLSQHLGLVHHTARQIAQRVGDAVAYDDLVGAGTLGLVQALESFDPARGFAFATFATQRIRGAVLDELRAIGSAPAARERPDADQATLTAREREILGHVAEGRTNGEIAKLLFISARAWVAVVEGERRVQFVSITGWSNELSSVTGMDRRTRT